MCKGPGKKNMPGMFKEQPGGQSGWSSVSKLENSRTKLVSQKHGGEGAVSPDHRKDSGLQ